VENTPTGHDGKNRPTGNWQWKPSDAVAAAGAITSTVGDLLSYAAYQIDCANDFLKPAHTKQGAGQGDFAIGLAWDIYKKKPYLYHGGNSGGCSCMLCICPEKGTASVALCNYGLLNLRTLGFALLDSIG
jgi:hypothetical protein